MSKWDFLYDIQKSFDFDLEIKEDTAVLINKITKAKIEIYKEIYYTDDQRKNVFYEYIVIFTTQHRHFDDLNEVDEYVRRILTDDVLPIEFYKDGKNKFGGELSKSEFEKLSKRFLAEEFGYTEEYISEFEYEIHSWSGKYDIVRQNEE